MKPINGGITAVPGVRATGVHAGLKPDNENDVALIAADAPAVAAGVFTKNRVCAPVVLVCRENLSDNTGQAIIINSKNANACTGEVGMQERTTDGFAGGGSTRHRSKSRISRFDGCYRAAVADG